MPVAKIIFAGTPDFSVPCLKKLIAKSTAANMEVVAVYTQPDRNAGRGRKIQISPVKQCALEHNIEVLQPASFKQKSARETLAALEPDLMVVVAYGLILPQSVLNIPRLGCINLHASLLPRWRGAAPIVRAIEAGDTQTGVCLMQMDKGLDTGDVIAQQRYAIGQNETGGGLHDALSTLGADLLGEQISPILTQSIQAARQPDKGMTYAHKLDKTETQIDWQAPAEQIRNKIRAFNPWPVASSRIGEKVIRIHQASHASASTNDSQLHGEIISTSSNGIVVQTGSTPLNIELLQKPGGKILPAKDFLNGFALQARQKFL